MKILAIKMRRLGDTALWTAALEALRELNPGVLAITYPAAYGALFSEDTRFQRRYPLPNSGRETQKWLAEVRSQKFDAVLNFHASPSSARLCKATGIEKRLLHFHERSHSTNRSSPGIPDTGKPMSAIERDLNLVRALGWKGMSPSPKLTLTESVRSEGRRALENAGIEFNRPIYCLSVGASRLSKRWPMENYLKLSESLSSTGTVVILSDQPNALGEFNPHFLPYAKTIFTPALTTLMGCLSYARCFIGSDSGVKHIAAALAIPTLTLFGPESVGEWHGYDLSLHPYLQFPVSCRSKDPSPPEFAWCGESICPLGSHACMTQLTPKLVYEKVQQVLLRCPPSPYTIQR